MFQYDCIYYFFFLDGLLLFCCREIHLQTLDLFNFSSTVMFITVGPAKCTFNSHTY